TTTRGQRIEVPLLPNRYALQRQGAFRNTIQLTERGDGTLVFGLAKNVSVTYQRQREAYQPATERIPLDFGLRTLFATDRGDLLGRGFMAHLAKLDRRITARAAHHAVHGKEAEFLEEVSERRPEASWLHPQRGEPGPEPDHRA